MKRHLLLLVFTQFLAATAFGYEAHEWGTFTSLIGSDGVTQNGMYHEDEQLPDFVHAFGETQFIFTPPDFSDCSFNFKTCFSLPVIEQNFVSQKMETPVIYFYSDNKSSERVTVDVKFPEGIITETFPAPTFSTPKNSEDLIIENGAATFVVDIQPNNILHVPPAVENNNIYGHARATQSNMISTNSEHEKFIFYRGLGRFQPKFQMTSSGDNLRIYSKNEHIPTAAFLINVDENGKNKMMPIIGSNTPIQPIGLFGESIFHISAKYIYGYLKSGETTGDPDFIYSGKDTNTEIIKALIESGLYPDEAVAMLNTWENGYLKVPGLRVLYILPHKEVDQILPLTMSPAPESIERVFVARIEVMLESEEINLVKAIMRDGSNFDISALGRFAEPQLRRAEQIYTHQHNSFQPTIPGFVFGLHSTFSELVQKSLTQDSSPLIVN